VRTRTLTGLDKVELWTEQSIWNAVLNGYRVIVSTHAVLADALSHGFVKMSRLALLIFDEGMSTFCALLMERIVLIEKYCSAPLHAKAYRKQNHAGLLPSDFNEIWPGRCPSYYGPNSQSGGQIESPGAPVSALSYCLCLTLLTCHPGRSNPTLMRYAEHHACTDKNS
jgi:hypothetical protein